MLLAPATQDLLFLKSAKMSRVDGVRNECGCIERSVSTGTQQTSGRLQRQTSSSELETPTRLMWG